MFETEINFYDLNLINSPTLLQSMKLLSTLAAIRLDEDGDNIENTLSLALVDTVKPGIADRSIQSVDPLASSSWERVRKLCATSHVSLLKQCPVFKDKTYVWLRNAFHEQVLEEKTLITPVQCKNLWRQFKAETEYTVTQAIAAQVLPHDPFQQVFCTFSSLPFVAQSFLFCLLLLCVLK
jgi:protein SEY1